MHFECQNDNYQFLLHESVQEEYACDGAMKISLLSFFLLSLSRLS